MNKWNELLNANLELDQPLTRHETTTILIAGLTVLGTLITALLLIGDPTI